MNIYWNIIATYIIDLILTMSTYPVMNILSQEQIYQLYMHRYIPELQSFQPHQKYHLASCNIQM